MKNHAMQFNRHNKNMLFTIKGISIVLLVLISGCASMEQMQNGMDEIDSFWGEVNQKIISSNGGRVYSKELDQCFDAARKTAIQLGFTIKEENSTSLTVIALTPTPFTKDEYKAIKAIEEPMMQAIAANHVGKFYSNFYTLDGSGKFYVTGKVNITPEKVKNKTVVQISFRIDPKDKIKGFIYGHNPPPESVKKGLNKWWNAFESNLGISEP
jgi:hypothetical protein